MNITYTPEIKPFARLIEDLCKFIIERTYQDLTALDKVKIIFARSPENEKKPLGNTGGYDPLNKAILVFVSGRHFKDCARSLSHELIHYVQDLRGEFPNNISTEPGYAQNNEDLRKLEEEAYRLGNILFRDWEDMIKSINDNNPDILRERDMIPQLMEKNNEINRILMENIAKKTNNKVLLEQLETERPFPTNGTRIDKIRWIVNEHQSEKIDGVQIDAWTAGALLAAWNRLNKQENKDKFEKLPIKTLSYFAIQQMKQGE